MDKVHPVLSYQPEPKKEYVELAGGFVLELHEILAGNELQRLDDRRADRKKGRVLTQAETRVNITAEEVDTYSWVEACCKAIYRVPEGGTWMVKDDELTGAEKVLESFDPQKPCFPYLDIVRASATQQDRLAQAGEKAWALTTGVDLEELKKGASATPSSTPEASESESTSSSALSSDASQTPPTSEDSPSEESTEQPTPELQTA